MDNAIRRIFGARFTGVDGGLESCGPAPEAGTITGLAPEITGYLQRPSLTAPECVHLHALIDQAAESSAYASEAGDEAQARRIDDWVNCISKAAEAKCPTASPGFSLIRLVPGLVGLMDQMLSELKGTICYTTMRGEHTCVDSDKTNPSALASYILADYDNYGMNLLGQGLPRELVVQICKDGAMRAAQLLRAQAHGRQ